MVQFSLVAQLSDSLWPHETAAHQASLSITNCWNPPKPMSIDLVMPSNHLILCHSLLLLPSIFPVIRVFSNESALCIRWPKYWSFCFNVSPFNEHPGQIFFRMDWLDLLAVQETLKSLLQHQFKSINSSAFSFFTVHLSHPYMTTGKTIALTRWTFGDDIMSLHFNILSRLVITFLPRSKRLLISVTICSDFGAQKNKVCHCFHCFPIYLQWSDGIGRDWEQEEKGTTEDEMAGWHHRLNGRKFEWTPVVGDGQRGLACCNSWGHKESDTTEWLNWTELMGLDAMILVF